MAVDSVGQIGLDLVVNKNQFEGQMAGIQGLAKKAGLALAAAFSVKKLIDFGKSAIDLGSQLAEVDNVIQQAVPSMEKQIDSFAKNAIQQFGMSETAAKRYTGVFASMSRGFGFSEKAAASMGVTLTGLAADVASFYDTSQDEAFTKLKGIFTGETEGLKSLGIVMTQANLDAYALANGYGKTTKAMSEAEKVALRYAFVQNQLRFAEGDFARTSGSWANQVRILSEQFNALKATIGQGLINVLTPVIQVINTIIGKLMSLANAFKALTEMLSGKKGSGGGGAAAKAAAEIGAVTDAADKASGAIGGTGGAAKKAAKDIKGMSTGIDELNIIDPKTDADSGSFGGGGGGGYAADEFDMGELDTSPIDEMNSKYQELIDRLKELASLFKGGFAIAFGDTSVLDSIKESIREIGESLKGIFTDPGVVEAANNFLNSFVFNLGKVVGAMASVGASIADNLLGGINKYLKQNSGRIKNFLISIFDIGSEVSNIVGRVSETFATVFEAFRSEDAKQITADIIGIFANGFMDIVELGAQFGKDIIDTITAPIINNKGLIKSTLEDTFSAVRPIFSELKSIVDEAFDGMKATYDKSVGPMFDSFKQGLTEVVRSLLESYNQYILPVIDEMAQKFGEFHTNCLTPLIDKFLEFVSKMAELITSVWETCLKPFVLWFIDSMVPIIGDALSKVIDIFFNLFEGISETLSYVLDALGGLIDFIVGVFTGDWERAWEGIKAFFSNTWNAIKELASTFMNLIHQIIDTVLNTIKNLWSAIWSGIKAFAENLWNGIKDLAFYIFTALQNKLSEIWDSIKQKTETVWNNIKSFFGELWTGLKDSATEIFESIRDKLSEIWDEVKQTVEDKWNAIKEWFDEIWQKIKDVFRLDEMLEIGKEVMNKFWDGMQEIWTSITDWLGGIAAEVGKTFNSVIDGAKNLFNKTKDDAEEKEDKKDKKGSSSSGSSKGYVSGGPGDVKGHSTGGFPRSGSMYIANEDGKSEYVGSWGGKAAVANNPQITEGITRAVQSGMRSSLAPLVSTMSNLVSNAAPPLAMVGSVGAGNSQDSQLKDMIGQAVAMGQGTGNMSDQYLSIMVDLLKKIVDLIEAMDLTVNIDIREIKKKLAELDKRGGYTLKTT